MMKVGLSAKLTTGVTLTPQMQQAIRLLQLSSLELEQEVQLKLDSNPLLEREEEWETMDNTADNQDEQSHDFADESDWQYDYGAGNHQQEEDYSDWQDDEFGYDAVDSLEH